MGVLQGEYDLGLIALSEITKEAYVEHVTFQTLFSEKLIVVANIESKAASQKELRYREILDYPLVVFDHELIWRFIRSLEREYGPVNILFSSSNEETICQAISDNLAIAIAPARIIEKFDKVMNESTTMIDIAGLESKYGLALAWANESANKGLVKAFLESQKLTS